MPRYFFDLFDEHHTIDEEGRTLANDAAAEATALHCARHLASASVLEGLLDRSHYIACRNATGEKLFAVTFGDAVRVPN
jgi:hypothetical protein